MNFVFVKVEATVKSGVSVEDIFGIDDGPAIDDGVETTN